MNKRHLKVIYVLPSKYDDEGYVLRFWRGILPSNTLCVLRTLTRALAESGALGEDVAVSVEVYDDTTQRVPVARIARENRRRDTRVVVGFVGVQTNQFPRASDLALQFRAAGVPVMIGGFHVSGILAMFGKPTPELQHLLDHGVTLVKGEAEAPGALETILRDALEGRFKPIYDIMDFPDLARAPAPEPDADYLKRYVSKKMGTIDTSRGCPFNCSFCTVINVQGRKMRCRSAGYVLKTIEENYARGVTAYFFTDDNFARSPVCEEVFDGLIALRERDMPVQFMMQIDTEAYRMRDFVDKAARAGCFMVFVGMESVNPANMQAAGKTHNKTDDYAEMVQTWHDVGVLVHVGYIIGMAHDTPESVRRDIQTLRDHVKVDLASFFMLAPLPGSEDHRRLVEQKVPLDADLNNFDTLHETFRHKRFQPGEWSKTYAETWDAFYTKENIVNVLLRTPPERYWYMFWAFIWYRFAVLDGTHPMFTGLVRLKSRTERRAIFAREGRTAYAWRRVRELARMAKAYVALFFEFQEIWLLTRKPDDPCWATLAELRDRWTDLRRRLHIGDLGERYDIAAQELQAMLATAQERLSQLAQRGKGLARSTRKKLRRKTQEIEAYLRSFELQMPSRQQILAAERYVSDSLVAGYEEVAIRYVAKRRQFNAYRQELIRRIKSGRLLNLNLSPVPRLLLFEIMVGLRFMVTFFSRV